MSNCLRCHIQGKFESGLCAVCDPLSSPKPSPADNVNHPAHYTQHPSGVESI